MLMCLHTRRSQPVRTTHWEMAGTEFQRCYAENRMPPALILSSKVGEVLRCYFVGVAFEGVRVLHSWLFTFSGIRLFITIRLNHHAHVEVILYRVVYFVLVKAAFEFRCLHEDGVICQKHIVQVMFVVKLECGIKLLLWCCEIERLAKPRANC